MALRLNEVLRNNHVGTKRSEDVDEQLSGIGMVFDDEDGAAGQSRLGVGALRLGNHGPILQHTSAKQVIRKA